ELAAGHGGSFRWAAAPGVGRRQGGSLSAGGLERPPAVVAVGDGRVVGEHRPEDGEVLFLVGEGAGAPVRLAVPAAVGVAAVPAVVVAAQELLGGGRGGVVDDVAQGADAGDGFSAAAPDSGGVDGVQGPVRLRCADVRFHRREFHHIV